MSLEKCLRYVVLGGLFLVLFVPLIITSDTLYPYTTGKIFVFRIVVGMIFGAWIILALRSGEYRPRFSPLVVAVVAFFLTIGLASILGEDPQRSFRGVLGRMEGPACRLLG